MEEVFDPCTGVRKRFDVSRAYKAQKYIAKNAVLEDRFNQIRIVVGLDVSYPNWRFSSWGIGVAVALAYPSMKILDCIAAVARVCVPYIPGLLAFREMAVLAPALARLQRRISVDLIVVDGHGIAHPRKAGIATHVGVVFDKPSIGVAKKKLYGEYREERNELYIVDDKQRPIAGVLGEGSKRIFVSPGHRVSLTTSIRLIKSMLRRGKLPEPTRIADKITKDLKKRITSGPPGREVHYIRCSGNRIPDIFS